MQSTMWPGTQIYIHFTLLTYALNKYASHITYMYPTALLLWYTCKPYSTTYISKNNQKLQLLFIMLLPYRCQQQMSIKCHIYSTYVNYFMYRYEITMAVNMPHRNSPIKNVTRGTGIHTFHTYWHMSLNKYAHHIAHICQMPPYYCTLHIDLKLLHLFIKNQ